MSEIPADILKAAEDALDNLLCNCVESCGGSAGLRAASINEIARAILAERERCGWHPIESAPISNGSNAFLAYITGHGCSVCYAGAGKFIYSVNTGRRILRATHWRPLPSPPKP